MNDFLERWLEGAGAAHEFVKLKEHIIVEQMLKQVPFEMRVRRRDHEPHF